ncbi:Wzy polymerase domain-containing protein [Dechloromonas sp. XY25]|uniref:Wzy polymerase domain-containing protein n=1 Tax=Dechloromonas hankyongensis TaxID=2908002 RepID=A0ABS9K0G0_9RHOO|nr:O-antigen ligase family protein [Dechloromonas hankyongensis]MCG2576650.1 Wzy polymerase domain-containing protein [Dechloromonas hankyongensis]
MTKILWLIAGACCIISWLVPNHYYPWGSYYNEIAAVFALIFAASAQFISRKNSFACIPVSVWVLFALSLYPWFQYCFGGVEFIGDSAVASLYIVGAAFSYYLGDAFIKNNIGTFDLFCRVLVFGGLVSGLIAIQQWLQMDPLGIWTIEAMGGGRSIGNIGQPNNLATLCLLGILATVWLVEIGRISSFVGWLAVSILGLAVATSRSRTALLQILFAILFVWLVLTTKKLRIKQFRFLIASCGLCVLLWFSLPKLSELMFLSSSGMLRSAQDQGRLNIWALALHAMQEIPMSGYGWLQIGKMHALNAERYAETPFFEYSHNFILDMVLWNGPVIGVVFLIGIAIWFYTRIKARLNAESVIVIAMIGLVGVHSLLEFPLYYAYFLFPIMFIAGMVEGEYAQEGGRGAELVIFSFAVLAVSGFGLLLVDYARVESEYRYLRMISAGFAPNERVDEIQDIRLLTQWKGFFKFGKSTATPNMSADELNGMEKIAHRFPFPPALFRYSIALLLNDQPDKADIELKRLRNMHGHERYLEALDALAVMRPQFPQVARYLDGVGARNR